MSFSEQIQSPWFIVGAGGQFLFFTRFLVQWIVSEQKGESTIPIAFWYCSFFGGLTMFIYVCHIGDLILMVGQFVGLIVYSRNLTLIYRKKRRVKEAAVS